MTRPAYSAATEALEDWLHRDARKPKLGESGTYEFKFANGQSYHASARSDEAWVRVDLALDALDPWSALQLNHELRGARLVDATPAVEASGLCLRAELALDPAASPVEQFAEMERALVQSLATIKHHERGVARAEKRAVEAIDDGDLAELCRRLEDSGWSARSETSDRTMIDLALPGRPQQGTITRTSERTCRVSTPLLRTPVTTALGRWAVGRFLLTAAKGYRAIRPAAGPDHAVHLEADLFADGSGEQLDRCLGPLAVAAREHAQEAELLGSNQAAAAAYAALRPDVYTPTLCEE